MSSGVPGLPSAAGRLALVLGVAAGVLGARCDPPAPPPDADTALYILARPSGSTFGFPAPAETDAIVQQVQAFYLEASFAKKLLRGADAPLAGGDVVGPVQATSSISCGAEDSFAYDVIRSLHPAVDFTRYDHLVVVAPDESCSVNGFDFFPVWLSLGGQLVRVDIVYINAVSLYQGGNGTVGAGLVAHELGHQFGLNHSGGLLCPVGTARDAGCHEAEYLNLIDTMGASLFFGHFNGFHKRALGWIEASQVVDVAASGRYLLTPLETADGGIKLLRIRRQSDSWLLVEYRTPTGFDADVPIRGAGAVVHLTRPIQTGQEVFSYVLRGPSGAYDLGPGEALTDARGHRIEVLDLAPSGVLVDVQLAPASEGTPPQLTTWVSSGSGPGRITVNVQASDASGLDRVELYSRDLPAARFDWTAVTLVSSHPAQGVGSLSWALDVAASSVADELEVVVYDGVGNVARKRAQ